MCTALGHTLVLMSSFFYLVNLFSYEQADDMMDETCRGDNLVNLLKFHGLS